jgi:hypothetical protein
MISNEQRAEDQQRDLGGNVLRQHAQTPGRDAEPM